MDWTARHSQRCADRLRGAQCGCLTATRGSGRWTPKGTTDGRITRRGWSRCGLITSRAPRAYWTDTAQEVYDDADASRWFTKEERAELTLSDRLKDEFEEASALSYKDSGQTCSVRQCRKWTGTRLPNTTLRTLKRIRRMSLVHSRPATQRPASNGGSVTRPICHVGCVAKLPSTQRSGHVLYEQMGSGIRVQT